MSESETLVTMQTQIAHLERFVDQLNEVLTSQGRQIDRQQSDINRLLKTIDDLKSKSSSGSQPASLEDEKPPHY